MHRGVEQFLLVWESSACKLPPVKPTVLQSQPVRTALGLLLFGVLLLIAYVGGRTATRTWSIERAAVAAAGADQPVVNARESQLTPLLDRLLLEAPPVESEIVRTGRGDSLEMLSAVSQIGLWGILPAATAIILCFVFREPVVALAGGVIVGGLILQKYDIAGDILVPAIGTSTGATILILYLWFLGGLSGLWEKTGATRAFAEFVTTHFVRGPRTARLAAWLLGVLFFQGGTLSTVLVGTAIRPVADRQRISHEETSYIVDSTASPIAVLLPFNAWPIYVQSLIFVVGVPVLATETSRIGFFFSSIPLFLYAWLAVAFTLLLCFDKLPFIGKTFRRAILRARETGELDSPAAEPLNRNTLPESAEPPPYPASPWEFFIPLLLLIGISVGTFFYLGSPKVLWAFGAALLTALLTSLVRGMRLRDAMDGVGFGLQGVVYGSVVLLLAVAIGSVARETGGAVYLADLLGESVPVWLLPPALFVLAAVIAFSTGTSWGTFAVTLPLCLPLVWKIGTEADLAHPLFYLQLGFAAALNGSIFGDQCSPISDTTVLSCVSTGCDLMDHVRTQIYPCLIAGGLACAGWTILSCFA